MPLTSKQVQSAKPGRYSDGQGLSLLVKPSGSKSWTLRVQHEGVRRDFGLGAYVERPVSPDYDLLPLQGRRLLTLEEARAKARLGRALAKAGLSPSAIWAKAGEAQEAPRTFREVATEKYEHSKKSWKNGKHRDEWISSLERHAFALIGDRAVGKVDAADVQRILLPIWLSKGETARRVKQRIGVVLDYAHAKGWRSSEAPMRAVNQLMRGMKQPKAGNFAAMPYKDLPGFAATLRNASPTSGNRGLLFLILSVGRSNEIRFLRWSEIDCDAAEWRIPAEKMKAGKPHIVPLVPAAMEILREMRGLCDPKPGDLVFPGMKGPMSDATMAKALRVNGAGAYTVHGFRSTFRDWAADNGYSDAWAEAALAHSNPNKTEAAYRRTTYFEQRRERLMPAWAAFALGDSPNVVSLASARA